MKIMVLTSRFPYPLEKGDKLRVYHQIKGLSKTHEIVLIALTDKPVLAEHIEKIEPFCSAIYTFKLNKFLIYKRVIWWFLRRKPIQVGYFTNKAIKRKIEQIVFKEKPDHIYCQLVRMAEYVKDMFHVTKTIDYMDAFSKGMERQAADTPYPLKYVYQKEAIKLKEYESKIFYEFDLKTIISTQDRDCIKNPFSDSIRIIPNGVDVEEFYLKEEGNKAHDLLFVGNMSYYPNVKAAEFLVEKVLAKLNEKKHVANVLIAGANPAPQVLALEQKGVKISGWVDDIVATYHSAKIFVAPLFHGSGLQNKILEAMASGVPVIATTQTNNAIKAMPGQEILLADNEIEFANCIVELLSDKALYQLLIKNARTFVEQNYSWSVCVNDLEKAIKEIE